MAVCQLWFANTFYSSSGSLFSEVEADKSKFSDLDSRGKDLAEGIQVEYYLYMPEKDGKHGLMLEKSSICSKNIAKL